MNFLIEDISSTVSEFKLKSNPKGRYSSFDYCYGYFKNNIGDELINKMEHSCLSLGFYLASWGMLRGSSFLLNKSIKHYEPTIEYISTIKKEVWDIDVDSYSEENIETIIEIYHNLKETLEVNNRSHLTLITKVMLGVFGNTPAYDRYFVETMKEVFGSRSGFSSLSKKSLRNIKVFYEVNQNSINDIANNTFIINFDNRQKLKLNYTKAKIIDMYGFTKGLKQSQIK